MAFVSAPYRQGLFEPTSLISIEAIDDAFAELYCSVTTKNLLNVLDSLLHEPRLDVLVLGVSTMPPFLLSELLSKYPSNPKAFLDSVHNQLLQRISQTLIPHFFEDGEAPIDFAQSLRIVQTGTIILRALVTFKPPKEHIADAEAEATPFVMRRGKTNQKKQKLTRHGGVESMIPVVEDKHYAVLEITSPSTPAEVSDILDLVLVRLRSLLELYTSYLQRVKVSSSLKEQAVYVPPKWPDVGLAKEDTSDQKLVEMPDTDTGPGSAFPAIQPMKSALYFDSPSSFGAWKIVISKSADDALRTARKKDTGTLKLILKKIKDLSYGQFSADNQKRLSSPISTDVAIYEAKISRRLRLVYQIDLIPTEHDCEEQVIKIFGIYTHAQMDDRLWASIGSQLRKKGPIYRDQCARRKRSEHNNSDLFVPESFPALPEIAGSDVKNLPDLLPDDSAEVHSRIVVEKFVIFSKAFLDSLNADIEATFPHLVSSQEKKIIENPTSCYVIGRSGTGKTTTMLFKMLLIERAYKLHDEVPKPRQVFVTKSRILAQKVQEYFEKLAVTLDRTSMTAQQLKDASSVANDKADATPQALVANNDLGWRADLPRRFSELEDKHFPLFITFDELCALLEADIPVARDATGQTVEIARKMIKYEDHFVPLYWAHFSETTRKGLDPALVFSEIIGVIKGSEQSLKEEKRFLSKVAYTESSSDRQQSALSSRKSDVYALFETYTNMKARNGAYDAADRTHRILQYLESSGTPGKLLNRLYVDEVQDNLLIDTMFLRALCPDPHGLFWAGDTAQTISVGSSFRFNELKAFQHRLDLNHQEATSGTSRVTLAEPELHQLAVNYRSHSGIVDCAHSVIELITKFWPNSIDRLAPEVGIVHGYKPVFFSKEDPDQLERFLFGDVESPIEFGAHQCILVRNEDAKKRLLAQVGEVGLIFTIYDSKGLEFNDVLLYDFFADSTVKDSSWRIVLNAIDDWTPIGKPISAPTFNDVKHAGICTELKSLYVAITRARANVWIADSSKNASSMLKYWMSRNVIYEYGPGKEAPQLAASSTLDEWEGRGHELFHQNKFGPAQHAYSRAKNSKLAAISGAYYTQQLATAISTSSKDISKRRTAFREAGEAFFQCACTEENNEGKTVYLKLSAECFRDGNSLERAAHVYRLAKDFNSSGALFRDIKKFDEAVEIVDDHGQDMSVDIVNSIMKRAKLAYFGAGDIQKASRLFDTNDEAVEYLAMRGLDMERADLLENLGQNVKAAELHYAEGRRDKAISLFLQNKEDSVGLQRGIECILENLWQLCSFGRPSADMREDITFQNLMALLADADASISTTQRKQAMMFRAIATDSRHDLLSLSVEFLKENNRPSALHCLNRIFSQPFGIQSTHLSDLVEELGHFVTYTRLLSEAASHPDVISSLSLTRLFGFIRIAENVVSVPPTAYYLHRWLCSRRFRWQSDPCMSHELAVVELQTQLKVALRNHLYDIVPPALEACRYVPILTPCLRFVLSGTCLREKCPDAHLKAEDIPATFYNQRLRAYMQQIVMRGAIQDDMNRHEPRSLMIMITHLYEALHPSHHCLGMICNLDLSFIPEARVAIPVLAHWLQSLSLSKSFYPPEHFLTDIMCVASLVFTFDRARAVSTEYVYQGKYHQEVRPKQHQEYSYHVTEHLKPFLAQDILLTLAGQTGRGAFPLHFIVEHRLPINISVLCDYMEFVTSSLLLCYCKRTDTFHEVTLPESWLLKFFEQDGRYFNPTIRTNMFWHIPVCMGTLLKQLYTGFDAGHLIYGTNRTLDKVPAVVRNVFILRIIRALFFLGYNTRFNDALRQLIRKAVASIKDVAGDQYMLPRSYRDFVDAAADSWEALAKVMRRCLEHDRWDKMIRLRQRSRLNAAQANATIKGVTDIIFQSTGGIPALLRGRPVAKAHETASALSEKVTTLVEGGDALVATRPNEEPVNKEINPPPQNTEEPDEQINVPAIVAPSEREHVAARHIQSFFRHITAHRKGLAKDGVLGSLNHFYAQYIAINIPWGLYRRMMVGPLLHFMLCLEDTKPLCIDHLNRTKKLLCDATSEEVDRLDEVLTATTQAHNIIIEVQKTLSPTSQMHKECDRPKFFQAVREANDVLSNLPFESPSELRKELELGVRGILKAPSPPKKKAKPDLVMDECEL